MKEMFRLKAASAEDLAAFHENGYVAFPAVLTDEGQQGLLDEILSREQIVDFLSQTDEERSKLNNPYRFSIRPWSNKGQWGEKLFDAPFVTHLLRATIGEAFHFCHSTLHISVRGARPLPFHQDNKPVNLAEKQKWYIQMLYYPNGFKRGDASLAVIPGSHFISSWGEHEPYGPRGATPEQLTELYGEQVGREFQEEHLDLPPGSMVFLNAKTFHAVRPKPSDSPQEFRLFVNYIFKEPGAPLRNTQVIPPEWIQRASPERRKLFQREAYSKA